MTTDLSAALYGQTYFVDHPFAYFLPQCPQGGDKVQLDQSHASGHALLITDEIELGVFEVTLFHNVSHFSTSQRTALTCSRRYPIHSSNLRTIGRKSSDNTRLLPGLFSSL